MTANLVTRTLNQNKSKNKKQAIRQRWVKAFRETMTQRIWQLSRLMGKPTICIGENKDADQLRGYQRLRFRYPDNTIPLLLKSEISSC